MNLKLLNIQTPMKTRALLSAIALGLSFYLTGCGALSRQADPTRYFALQAPARQKLKSNSGIAAGIGPITIPGYLDHKEIVIAGPSHDLILAPYHVWAEPLEKAMTRVVAMNVSVLLDSPNIVPFPDSDVKQDYRVSIVIRRFEMEASGQVRLEASYTIEGAPGSGRSGTARSRSITVGVARPDDYAAIVESMSRAAAELSSSLARDLLTLRGGPTSS